MNPWFEASCVILVAVFGVFLGRVSSRLQKPYWMLAFLLPVAVIAILALARWNNALYFVWPFCRFTTGRTRFVVLSLAISMGLTIPLSRLPRKCEKVLVCILMAVVVTWSCVFPFLVPALIKDQLSNLTTRLDPDGICLQTTHYTCGPAAAVTALGKLGLAANEGEIAVLSYSSPVAGTLPTFLCSALQNRYGPAGLKCQYRRFDSIDQLKDAGITLAVVKDGLINNHCVTILGVSDYIITIADPVVGRRLMSHEQFKKVWRFSGIVLKRDST